MSEDHLQAIPFQAPTLEELDVLLDGYKFEDFIAQGGMGAVYLARQTSLDRQVAIKVLPRELGEDVSFQESFQSEAKHMARLNHPNLISIYDFGNIDGMLYIIMEFVKGLSLHDAANGQAIIQETAAELVRDICLGVGHAHDAGILHRDIKPANILLGKKDIPKIGDFGLARPAENTETGVIYGTPGYAAPEVVSAPDTVDARTDVFAVGVMFYELLTGVMPDFNHYQPVHEIAEVDMRFDEIVQKAIQPNPDSRYSSADALAKDITQLLKDLKDPQPAARVNPLLTPGTQAVSTRAVLTPETQAVSVRPAVVTGTQAVSARVATSAVSARPVSASMNQVPKGNGARNACIIVVLLAALFGAFKYKDWKVADVAKQEAEAEAVADEIKSENDKIRNQIKAEKEEERRLAQEARRKQEEHREKNKISGSSQGKKKVTAKDILNDLKKSKYALAAGERTEELLPETVFYRDGNSRAVFFVDKKMTWAAADEWASRYGAQLAVCSNKSDMRVFSEKAANGTAAWLGGSSDGNKGWVWVDGTEWSDYGRLRGTKKRAFVTLSDSGNLKAERSPSVKLPFFIEWKMEENEDGDLNPGSLESRLVRASKDLDGSSINPQYPAGAVNLGTRTYCPISRTLTYAKAEELARTAGGHLLVISNPDEMAILADFVDGFLLPGQSCWVGGQKSNALWSWTTGEEWVSIPWVDGYPKSGGKLQLLTGKSVLFKDGSASDEADMFIIEWSDDKKNAVKSTATNSSNEGDAGLKKINDWHSAKCKKEVVAAEKLFASNVRKLTFDLEAYLKGLTKGDLALEEARVLAIHKEAKSGDRIPTSLSGKGTSKRVRGFTTYGVDKQARIEQDLNKELEKLRQLYIKHLKNYRTEMATKGQDSIVKAIDEAAQSVGKNASSYREHFNQ